MSERSESMWYCPDCGAWVGSRLDVCPEDGHKRPRLPLRSVDVEKTPAYEVTRWDRIRARLGWYALRPSLKAAVRTRPTSTAAGVVVTFVGVIWASNALPADDPLGDVLGLAGFVLLLTGFYALHEFQRDDCACGARPHHRMTFCPNCGREVARE